MSPGLAQNAQPRGGAADKKNGQSSLSWFLCLILDGNFDEGGARGGVRTVSSSTAPDFLLSLALHSPLPKPQPQPELASLKTPQSLPLTSPIKRESGKRESGYRLYNLAWRRLLFVLTRL